MPEYRFMHLTRADCPIPEGSHVVAYCRDSGGEGQDNSVQQQRQVMEEYCQCHGLILEEIYEDPRALSSNTDKRHGLKRMLETLEKRFPQIRDQYKRRRWKQDHHFGVLVWKFNRLSRDSTNRNFIKSDLRMRGLTIVDLVDPVDTGNEGVDHIVESVYEVNDQQLLEQIGADARRGLHELVTVRDTDAEFRRWNPDWPTSDGRYLGLFPGTPPTGFKAVSVHIGQRGRKREQRWVQCIVPNHDNYLWERCFLAWQMRHNGSQLREIMQATRLFKTASCYSTFFQNRIYTGDLEYGGVTLENFVEALIPRAWYEQEQARIRARAEKPCKGQPIGQDEPRRVASSHLLSGLVYCTEEAGQEHPMAANSRPANPARHRSAWRSYICVCKKNTRGTGCRARAVSAASLEQAVIDVVLTHILTGENLRPLAPSLLTDSSQRRTLLMTRLETAHVQLKSTQRAIAKLIIAIEQTEFSASLKERLEAQERELLRLRAEITALNNHRERMSVVPALTDDLLDSFIQKLSDALLHGDRGIAKRIVRTLVSKVTISAKQARIYLKYPLEPGRSPTSSQDGLGLAGEPGLGLPQPKRKTHGSQLQAQLKQGQSAHSHQIL